MPKNQKTIKAWAIVNKDTGEICHYQSDTEVSFYRFKNRARNEYPEKYYKIVKVEIKILK